MNGSVRVVIRADATTAIGTGHAMRCLALASTLRHQGAEVLLYGTVGPAIAARYADAGIGVVEPSPVELADPSAMRARLAGLLLSGDPQAAWAVFDGYAFDADDHKAVRDAGARVLVIDDYGHLPWYGADIILNQNISADAVHYAVPPDCAVLRGLKYALLRPEFKGRAVGAGARRTGRASPDVLLSMGGADPGNATQAILDALPADLLQRIRLHLLVGPHNPHRTGIEAWVRASGARAIIHSAVQDMPALLASMDHAVTAAGSTCWELMCMGLPFVTVVLAENQRAIAERLDAEDIARSAGRLDETAPEGAVRAAALLRELLDDPASAWNHAEANRSRVDGRGAMRVADAMLRGEIS